MSIKTIRETDNYSYDIDTAYGTGWFVRKRDDMVTLMDTGSDVELAKLSYQNATLVSDEAFDIVAENQTYVNRWSEDS